MNELRQRIADLIRREGPIPFSRYMQMCLYESDLGYYARPREQFGKSGDFYTSSDVHAVFGRLLCRQFHQMWEVMGTPKRLTILELGPGRGLFALDVLDWAKKKFPEFSATLHYGLVETSETLRSRQRERLAIYIESGQVSIHSSLAEAEPHLGPSLIVFANEFFDALPVDIVSAEGEVRVAVDNAGRFHEVTAPPRPELHEYLQRFSVTPEPGGRVEVNLLALDYMQQVARLFEARQGFCIFVDYGYTREQQRAGRHLDTLMTYREHRAGTDPFRAPGEEDITAHVNFTALRNVAEARGMLALGLVTQSQFLMGIGEPNQFADAFEDAKLPQENAKIAMQLKHLVTPVGIGEIFQVLVLARDVSPESARNLHGLKFAR